MKIAYIILAHKNPTQIARLVNRLCDQPCEIFLHIDRNASPQDYSRCITQFQALANVHLLPRFASHWGSYRLVQATLAGIQACLRGAQDCEYAFLLSGQDYPVRPLAEFYQFLQGNPGASYLGYSSFPNPEWSDRGGYDRIEKWHVNLPFTNQRLRSIAKRIFNRFLNTLLPARRFPAGFSPYGGAQWWCLHRDCLEYIDQFCRKNGQFQRFFQFVRVPDEIFFHTILLNSPLKAHIQNRMLTYVDWHGPPYPRVLSASDLPAVAESGCFFARKFDIAQDPSVLDVLDQSLDRQHAYFVSV